MCIHDKRFGIFDSQDETKRFTLTNHVQQILYIPCKFNLKVSCKFDTPQTRVSLTTWPYLKNSKKYLK